MLESSRVRGMGSSSCTPLDDGVRTGGASMSTKFTVLRGVVRVAALRLTAARVMSCSCRPELEREARDDP